MERTPVEHIEEYIKNKQALGHRFGVDDLLDVIKEAKQMEKELSKLHQPTVIKRSECCNALIDTDEQSCEICVSCGDRI